MDGRATKQSMSDRKVRSHIDCFVTRPSASFLAMTARGFTGTFLALQLSKIVTGVNACKR
jgi:hypothetical protein